MRIILTGSSGFLGKAIKEELAGAELITLARNNADIIADLSGSIPQLPHSNLVIHCAGKAHMVPKSEQDKQEFFNVNVTGTRHLLKALEKGAIPQYFIFISTVAVYGIDTGNLINEDAPLLAQDPYGLSKIQAEQLVTDWCHQHKVKGTILRLPLLAGPNPPGNLRAMINGIKKGYYFNIAGGRAKKSMVLARDVAKIIPHVAKIGGTYNLTDGYHPSFFELGVLMSSQLNKRRPGNMPNFIAKLLAVAGNMLGSKSPINSDKLKKITSDLTFDDARARELLAWKPTPVLKDFKIF